MSQFWIFLCITLATLAGAFRAQTPTPDPLIEPRGQQIIDVVPTDQIAYAVHQLNSTMIIMAYSGVFGAAGPAIRFRGLSMDRNETGISSRTLTTKNFTDPQNVGGITSGLHMVYDSADVALIYQNASRMCIQTVGLRPPPGGGGQQTPPLRVGGEATYPHISTISFPPGQQKPPNFSILYSRNLAISGVINGTCLLHVLATFEGFINTTLLYCPIAPDSPMDPLAEIWYHPLDTNSVFIISKAGSGTLFEVRRCMGITGIVTCVELMTGVNGIPAPTGVDMVASRRIQSSMLWFAWRSSGTVSIACLMFDQTSVSKVSKAYVTSHVADSFSLVDSLNRNGVTLVIHKDTTISRFDFSWTNDTDIGLDQTLTLDTSKLTLPSGYPFSLATDNLDTSIFALVSTLDGTSVSLNYFAVPSCGNSLVSPGFEECDLTLNCNATCQCIYGVATNGGCLDSSASTPPTPLVPAAGGNTPSNAVSPPTPEGLTTEELVRIVVPSVVIPVIVAAGVAVLVVLLQRRKKSKRVKDDKVRLEPANYQSMPSANPTLPNDSKSSQAASGEHTSIPIGLAPLNTMSTDERMKIPYSDLKVIREIGAGAYGKVFLGEWQMTQVALKVSGITSSDEFVREAELLINLRPHPNVVQILGVSTDGLNVVMIMEYCDGGSLDHLVKGDLSTQTKIKYLSGIAKGIYHLHKNNIIHRDLAARNILLSRGEPKISDFGMSRKVQEAASHGQTRSTVGPLRWMAPESLKSSLYSSKSDVWSFGILLWEVLTGKEPHLDSDPLAIGIEIRDKGLTPPIPDNINPELAQLLRDCWQLDPELRPDFAEICKRINRIQP